MCGLALMCAAALGRSCRRRPLLQLAKRDAPRGDGGLFADFGNKTGTARPDAGRRLHVRLQGVERPPSVPRPIAPVFQRWPLAGSRMSWCASG